MMGGTFQTAGSATDQRPPEEWVASSPGPAYAHQDVRDVHRRQQQAFDGGREQRAHRRRCVSDGSRMFRLGGMIY